MVLAHMSSSPLFRADLDVLARDAALQRATAEGLLRAVRRLAALGLGGNSDDLKLIYANATGSLQRLFTEELAAGLLAACDAPESTALLLGVVDSVLSRPKLSDTAGFPELQGVLLHTSMNLLALVMESRASLALERRARLDIAGRVASAVVFTVRRPETWGAEGYSLECLLGALRNVYVELTPPGTDAGGVFLPPAGGPVSVLALTASFEASIAVATLMARPEPRAAVLAACKHVTAVDLDQVLMAAMKWGFSHSTGALGPLSCESISLSEAMAGVASVLQAWARLVQAFSALCGPAPAGLPPGAWPGLAQALPRVDGVRQLVRFKSLERLLCHLDPVLEQAMPWGVWAGQELDPPTLL